MKNSTKKVVVITGAGKGIGRSCALVFAKAGFRLALISRTETDLKKLQSECKKQGADPLIFTGDASDKKTVDRFFQAIDKKLGKVDVLINNAGLFRSESFITMSANMFQSQWKTNAFSTFLNSQEAAKRMIPNQSGQIINVVSVAAKQVFEENAAYASSKFAQDGLTKVMRQELKKFNIRVTNIYPGATYTNSLIDSENSPKDMMTADDVATAILNVVNLDSNIDYEELVLRPVGGDL